MQIFTQGEGLLPVLQEKYNLDLALKSYYLQVQFHEDYVQVTVNQVIRVALKEEEAAAIIRQDKTVSVRNVFGSLCNNIWKAIAVCSDEKKENLCIDYCEVHQYTDKSRSSSPPLSLTTKI